MHIRTLGTTRRFNRSYFFQRIRLYLYLLNCTRRLFLQFHVIRSLFIWPKNHIFIRVCGQVKYDSTKPLNRCQVVNTAHIHIIYTYIYRYKRDLYLYLYMMQSNNIFPIRLYTILYYTIHFSRRNNNIMYICIICVI